MATAKHKPRPRRSTNDATVRRQNQIIEQAICILEARAHVPGEFIDNTKTSKHRSRSVCVAIACGVHRTKKLPPDELTDAR